MEEIIPKPIVKPSLVLNIILYLSIMLFLGVAGFYIYLIASEKKAGLVFEDLERAITEAKTPTEQELETRILTYQKKLRDFDSLLTSHQSAQDFFKLLEENCHPNVWFSNSRLDLKEFKLSLSGEAENFQTVEQQIFIFRALKDITEVNLSALSIGKEGRVSFDLDIILSPKLFSF